MQDPSVTPSPTAFPETADIETSSDEYAARFAGPTGQWMLRVQERITLDRLRGVPGRTVLDVGGGHGQLARPLCREKYAVTVLGSDASCRHRIDDLVRNGACRFLTGNVVALPFPDRSFDAVLSFRLLTHCERWPVLVGELCRVARHSVIVDYPTRQSLNAVAPALFSAKKQLEGNTRAWRLFTHAEIAGAFAAAGFAPSLRRAGQFFFPMVLHRALRCRPLSTALEKTATLFGLTAAWGSPVIVRMDRSTSNEPGAPRMDT